MTLEEIVRKIPSTSWELTSEKLIDIVLNSPDAKKMPSSLAKTLLYYWQREQLATEIGLQRLLEASVMINPDKTVAILKELGFEELKTQLESY